MTDPIAKLTTQGRARKLDEDVPLPWEGTLRDVSRERASQARRWGDQSAMPDWALPDDPIERAQFYGVPTEEDAQRNCDESFEFGTGTWADVLVEEVAEVIGAATSDDLRSELVQLAAVATAWIEAIDLRHQRGAA